MKKEEQSRLFFRLLLRSLEIDESDCRYIKNERRRPTVKKGMMEVDGKAELQ